MPAFRILAIFAACLLVYACGSNSDSSNDVTDSTGPTSGISQPRDDDTAVDTDTDNNTGTDTRHSDDPLFRARRCDFIKETTIPYPLCIWQGTPRNRKNNPARMAALY
jgi:phosphate/sulfate permease